MAVMAAGFQQQHAMAARRGQPVGQHAAGRAGADDDVIEAFAILPLCHGAFFSLPENSVKTAACGTPGLVRHGAGSGRPERHLSGATNVCYMS